MGLRLLLYGRDDVNTLILLNTNSIKKCDRCVGWVEQSETQFLQDCRVLGYAYIRNNHFSNWYKS
jgi:hypothetical protein